MNWFTFDQGSWMEVNTLVRLEILVPAVAEYSVVTHYKRFFADIEGDCSSRRVVGVL